MAYAKTSAIVRASPAQILRLLQRAASENQRKVEQYVSLTHKTSRYS